MANRLRRVANTFEHAGGAMAPHERHTIYRQADQLQKAGPPSQELRLAKEIPGQQTSLSLIMQLQAAAANGVVLINEPD